MIKTIWLEISSNIVPIENGKMMLGTWQRYQTAGSAGGGSGGGGRGRISKKVDV